MKKNIILIIFSFLFCYGFSQPLDTRATISASGLTANVFAKPDSPISFPFPNNVIAMNLALSLPAFGETDPAMAPTFQNIISALPNLAINQGPVIIEDDRFVYTFAFTGNTPNTPTWLAGSENLVATFVFAETASGQFPRLDNRVINTPQSYFYFEVGGIQRSDTEGEPFYNGLIGQYNPDELWVESLTALPIKLTTFDVEKHGLRSSKLSWTTESEINGSHFEIERSTDGQNWDNVGQVEAIGNSTQIEQYSFIDDRLPISRNTVDRYYYRLRMVDLDGSFEYSQIRSVSFVQQDYINVKTYPNPTVDQVFVDITGSNNVSAEETTPHLQVIDGSGRLIISRETSLNTMERVILTDFPGNIFFVRVIIGDKVFTERIVKSN